MVDPTLCRVYLDRLQKALWEHGLEAGIRAPALVARTTVLTDAESSGSLMCPRLEHKVEVCEVEGGDLWWCRVEPAARPAERVTQAAIPRYARMCPAEDIGEATRQILAALRPDAAAEEPAP
jgi:hypothetical protein